MGELGEFYGALRAQRREKKANNREYSAQLLRDNSIVFTEHNNGAHLVVEGLNGYIDFWPGTGKWKVRNDISGFGVKGVLAYLGATDHEGS